MADVIDLEGRLHHLEDCDCGAEPKYYSANGLAHRIICRVCGRQTDREMCGLDAVWSWNNRRLTRAPVSLGMPQPDAPVGHKSPSE